MNNKDKKKLMIKLFNTNLDISKFKNMKFKDTIDEFFYRIRAKASPGNTNYMKGKLPRIKEYMGERFVNEIDEHALSEFTYYLHSRPTKPCNRTINKYRDLVVRIIKDITGRHIYHEALSFTEPDIIPIDEYDIKIIIEFLVTNIKKYHNEKYLLIILLFLDTGVRINELVNIRKDMIDINNRSIRLLVTKTSKNRTIFFTETTKKLLVDYIPKLDDESLYLFPGLKPNTHLRTESVYRALVRIGNRLNINASIRPHLWRHTHAMTYLLHGGDLRSLQLQLGHVSIKTTERYLHMADKTRKKQYDSTFEGIYASTALRNVVI